MKKNMLRIASALLAALLLFTLVPLSALAADSSAVYGTLPSGQFWDYDESTRTLHIFGTGNVTEDGDCPFEAYRDIIQAVYIGEGITGIGNEDWRIDYFNDMDALTSLALPQTLTSLAGFESCDALQSVFVPGNVKTIGRNTFRNCESLRDVYICNVPEQVGTWFLGGTAYAADPSNWKNGALCIANWVIEIDHSRNISIPEGMIGYVASPLEWADTPPDLTFPASMRYVDAHSFLAPIGRIDVAAGNPWLKSDSAGVLYDAAGTTLYHMPVDHKGSYIIPDTVTKIREYAFYNCSPLEQLTLPDSIRSIGEMCMNGCCKSVVHIPAQLEQIGPGGMQFLHLDGLPTSLRSIGECAFFGCTFPNGTKANLGKATELGASAFALTMGIDKAVFPEGLTEIPNSVFSESDLCEVCLPSSLQRIEQFAFSHTRLTQVSIPAGVESICWGAFCSCELLEELTVMGKNTLILPPEDYEDLGITLGESKTTLVFAPSGSDAERYAKQFGYDFCPLSDVTFSDVQPGSWYYSGVTEVAQRGLMAGIGNGLFRPNDTATRAMLVTVLYRMAGCPEVKGDSVFRDVKSGSWYEKAVIWAQQEGIISGCGNGKFCPNDAVTREQAAVMFCGYLRKIGALPAASPLSGFADSNAVSSWAAESMQTAVSAGLLCGKAVGAVLYLAPRDTLTRAELAVMLLRL